MRAIYKYPLTLKEKIAMMLPSGAILLTVQPQQDSLCLWALVDPSAPNVMRYIDVVGTGNPVPEDLGPYIATAQIDGYVWHFFEVVE